METQSPGSTTSSSEGGGMVLVLIGLALLTLLYSCVGGSGSDGASGEPAGSAPVAALPATSGPSASTAVGVGGTLTAGGDPVLPRVAATRIGPGGSLKAYSGREAVATSVPVASVPADEGFWVGYGFDDRVWVELTGTPSESPYDVDSGDLVSFTGRMVANAKGFPKKSGVTDAEGRKQLEAQGQHVAVDKDALRLNK